jgi:hypothetical protein
MSLNIYMDKQKTKKRLLRKDRKHDDRRWVPLEIRSGFFTEISATTSRLKSIKFSEVEKRY